MIGAAMTGVLCLLGFLGWWVFVRDSWKKATEAFPQSWRKILREEVNFYRSLNPSEKHSFETRVQEFLLNYDITGVKTSVDEVDKVLIASSGVIPVFKFENWRYTNLREVLLYPSAFNFDLQVDGPDRRVLGMVGSGRLKGLMILSKTALRGGFANEKDRKNTAIHEFIHLIDWMDGAIDGIPELLIERPYIIPWLDLIREKMADIYEGDSDINPYGGTNRIEFFAVASEYFFERPKLLAKKHPELYQMLEDIYDHKMNERLLNKKIVPTSRNSPCPCGSGKKYKRCCLT